MSSLMDKYNEWRGKDRRRREVVYVTVTHELSRETADLAERLIETIANTSHFPDLEFMKQRLELIHGLTFDLNRKVEEFMSTQESRLQGIQTALTSIAEGINTLQEQVATLKVNNPDMEDEIAGIESTVKAIADDINGVSPGAVTPAPEGGGTEGGGTPA